MDILKHSFGYLFGNFILRVFKVPVLYFAQKIKKLVWATRKSFLSTNTRNYRAKFFSGIGGSSTRVISNIKVIGGNSTELASNTKLIGGNSTELASNTKLIGGNFTELASNTKLIGGNSKK
ncbi:hypothetical protein GCM10025857_62030 [Alicyclobacillus contaminans]|nr:hypothetical protein GCM10025857_62030 [Alicyclobacillus contaminans]